MIIHITRCGYLEFFSSIEEEYGDSIIINRRRILEKKKLKEKNVEIGEKVMKWVLIMKKYEVETLTRFYNEITELSIL